MRINSAALAGMGHYASVFFDVFLGSLNPCLVLSVCLSVFLLLLLHVCLERNSIWLKLRLRT